MLGEVRLIFNVMKPFIPLFFRLQWTSPLSGHSQRDVCPVVNFRTNQYCSCMCQVSCGVTTSTSEDTALTTADFQEPGILYLFIIIFFYVRFELHSILMVRLCISYFFFRFIFALLLDIYVSFIILSILFYVVFPSFHSFYDI